MRSHKHITPFPTVFNTERPDTVAAGLLEGRVAIMVDGTPFALPVPALFTQFFQSGEDYYSEVRFRHIDSPAPLFVICSGDGDAVVLYRHYDVSSGNAADHAALQFGQPAGRRAVPGVHRSAAHGTTFEILREASVRMPKTIGQSISIVGTLVIDQASVEAGLVSAAMVIVVSITAISNFVLPAFNMEIVARMLRFLLMVLAATFGLYGIFMGMILVVVHLCTLPSFGVHYMAPMAPFRLSDQKDTLFRFPMPNMIKRPESIRQQKPVRQNKREGPS